MSNIAMSVTEGVATIVIQRCSSSNVIDITAIRSLHLALDQIQKGDSGARAVVLTGCGDVFCSGIDLHSIDCRHTEARQRAHFEMRRFMDPLISRLATYRFPIIAAVNGAAAGAGMSLALATDIILAADNAYFLPSFARLGLVPDAGITFHLARRIGGGRALSSLMLAERIDATTALQWGLVYQVVPHAELLGKAQALAHRLATGPVAVLGQIRQLHAQTFEHTLAQQLKAERSAQEMSLECGDCVEGVKAFFEKREPHFTEG